MPTAEPEMCQQPECGCCAEAALQIKRIAELEADLADTLRAVLHHFGPDGAHKVTETVLEIRSKR